MIQFTGTQLPTVHKCCHWRICPSEKCLENLHRSTRFSKILDCVRILPLPHAIFGRKVETMLHHFGWTLYFTTRRGKFCISCPYIHFFSRESRFVVLNTPKIKARERFLFKLCLSCTRPSGKRF